MPNTPNYRVVTKVGDKRWEKIGAGWIKKDNISIQLNVAPIPNNGKINFLLVPNEPKNTQ